MLVEVGRGAAVVEVNLELRGKGGLVLSDDQNFGPFGEVHRSGVLIFLEYSKDFVFGEPSRVDERAGFEGEAQNVWVFVDTIADQGAGDGGA